MGIGALERLVLHQCGLHQRIDGVGGLPQAVPDQTLRLGVARGILQGGEAVEQVGDEFAFLWGHWSFLPPVTTGLM